MPGQVVGMCGCDLNTAPAVYNEARLADVHALQVGCNAVVLTLFDR